jgi:hypothetical protein
MERVPKILRLHPLDHGNVDRGAFTDLGRVMQRQFKPKLRQADKDGAHMRIETPRQPWRRSSHLPMPPGVKRGVLLSAGG